ncbi:hypothetical protein EIK77_010666 [Talaromyces pinophilus]|nr:hypothetical protein EIK77_010666 [Talaromyces pinophilus]
MLDLPGDFSMEGVVFGSTGQEAPIPAVLELQQPTPGEATGVIIFLSPYAALHVKLREEANRASPETSPQSPTNALPMGSKGVHIGEDSLDFTLPLTNFSVTPFIYDLFPLPQDTPYDSFENIFHYELSCSNVTIAFQKIVGRWDPDLQNHRAAEEGNISLKPATDAADTSSAYARYPLSHQSVSLNTRDDLLAAVLKNCEPHNVAKVASAFPPPQMIEQLLLRFLDSHSLLEDTWIHVPTFRVDDTPPDLLLSCIASCAMDSSNNNLRRFGKALHSVLHPYLFQEVSTFFFPTVLRQANNASPKSV